MCSEQSLAVEMKTGLEPVPIEHTLLERLTSLYGGRARGVVEALASIGSRYFFRTNSLTCQREVVLKEISSSLARAVPHEDVADADWFAINKRQVQPRGTEVVADKFAAEAVLQGAHLYSRGVKKCSGLKLGAEASVMGEKGAVAGVGVARQGETSILNYRQGLAVEVQESRFGLPSLMDTKWHIRGRFTFNPFLLW